MIGALFNGLSGLDTFQRALNTQSNNVANVNTAGYKADTVTFADMIYQDGVGKGSSLLSIEKDFSQGELKVTSNPYDLALNGDGFFVVDDAIDDENKYTRAGNFRMADDGYLKTPDLRNVLGTAAAAVGQNDIISTDTNFQIFTPTFNNYIASQVVYEDTGVSTINAKTTNYVDSAETDLPALKGNGYKTAGIKISDVELLSQSYRTALKNYSKNPTATDVESKAQINSVTLNPATLNDRDFIKVFVDDQYVTQAYEESPENTLKALSDKISAVPGLKSSVDTTTGELTITALEPGATHLITEAYVNDTVYNVNTDQEAVKGTGTLGVVAYREALKTAVENAGAKFLQITNGLTYIDGNVLPAQLDKIQLNLDELSLSTNGFGDFSVSNDGVVMIEQDGSKFVVGKIEIAKFPDNLELTPEGNNVFAETDTSGAPLVAGSISSIVGGTLEMSNSNLAQGLTELMIYQRSFEANARTLSTSDEFLNIAIQLKK